MTKSWWYTAALQNLISHDKPVSFPCLALSSDVPLLTELTHSCLLVLSHLVVSWVWILDPSFLCSVNVQSFDRIVL